MQRILLFDLQSSANQLQFQAYDHRSLFRVITAWWSSIYSFSIRSFSEYLKWSKLMNSFRCPCSTLFVMQEAVKWLARKWRWMPIWSWDEIGAAKISPSSKSQTPANNMRWGRALLAITVLYCSWDVVCMSMCQLSRLRYLLWFVSNCMVPQAHWWNIFHPAYEVAWLARVKKPTQLPGPSIILMIYRYTAQSMHRSVRPVTRADCWQS